MTPLSGRTVFSVHAASASVAIARNAGAQRARRRLRIIASAEPDRLLALLGDAAFEIVDVLPAGLEARVGEDALLQRHVGLDAFDDHFRQRDARTRDRGRAV